MRKLLVKLYGRRPPTRPPGWRPKSKPEPTYTRLDTDERVTMVKLHAQGRSDRLIGRELDRDHKTVARALEPRRIKDLAFDLVQIGQDDAAAVWVAQQVGSVRFERFIRGLIRKRDHVEIQRRRQAEERQRRARDPKVAGAMARRHPELRRLGLV